MIACDTADSLTLSAPAAARTDPSRATRTNAFSCVSVIAHPCEHWRTGRAAASAYTQNVRHQTGTRTERATPSPGRLSCRSPRKSSTRRPPAWSTPSRCSPGTRLGARILACGHSLIPMMKLRLAQPEVLIDVNGIRGLRYIERVGGELRIGALARHADLLAAPLAGEHFAILHDAERVIADPIVRNWGTIGGSLCQADPSEDLSAAFAALEGLDGHPRARRQAGGVRAGVPHRPVRDRRRPGRDADRDQAADPARQRQRVPEGGPPGGRLADRRGRGGRLARGRR